MRTTVELGSWAKPYVSDQIISLEMAEGATLFDLISKVGLPEEEVGVAVLNGKAIAREYVLANEDRIKLHPAVFGG